MKDFFGPDGILKQRLPHFDYRPQQEALAEKIEDFLLSDQHILAAEAPTGIGKTYAMLIPAILWAVDHNETILVLTSGITLQEQLIGKDIPALLDALGMDLPYGLLKGRGNYACLRRAREISQEGYLDFGGDQGRASRSISSWLYSTETGDLSELALPENHPARERIASSYLTCMGNLCPCRDHCFYSKVIHDAQHWRIVVANYHVFFSYVLAQKKSFPVPYGLVLCDEAHKMEDAARSVMQVGTSERDWQRLLRRAPALGKTEAALLRGVGETPSGFASKVANIGRLASGLFSHIASKLPDGRSFSDYPEELKNDTAELIDQCDTVIHELSDLQESAAASAVFSSTSLDEGGKISVWNNELTEYRDSLRWCSSVSSYPQWAYWREGSSLRSSCVTGSDLIPQAFDDENVKVIALSATLTVDHSFEYWAGETGMMPDTALVFDSPFDLPHQMEVDIVDLGMSVIADKYADAVARVCRKYARANGGATLILLSSRKLLAAVSQYLKENSDDDNLNILVQGDLPRTELLELFKSKERSVLVGMASFREGIDVPGEALTQVIIDRIPFPHPDDPVGAARAKLEGAENFMKVVLPAAKMQLRQAAGRLVRSPDDHGKVVILDGRVISRPNWKILESLPRVPIKKFRLTNTEF
jgi:ATP-dependent DNA helicase DinG